MSIASAYGKSHRLIHFTPLRYPGGKGKLAHYIKELITNNIMLDGEYVEPYAGGAAIALELLFHEYVSRVHINDVSYPVYAFWRSVLDHTEELCRLVLDTPRSIESWDRQKKIMANRDNYDVVSVGFATFFLNRTNRSGILNAGIIGGRNQTGFWKIDARYNAAELIHRIQSIAEMKKRIRLTRLDALQFMKRGAKKWPERTLIYLDPPYYLKGRDLYYDFYGIEDHRDIANFLQGTVTKQKWIVSYDDVQQIRSLYDKRRSVSYDIGYSARAARRGAEVMFFCDTLKTSPLFGHAVQLRNNVCSQTISS